MSAVALIGYGYWGKNLLRNINSLLLWDKIYVFDVQDTRRLEAQKIYPAVHLLPSMKEVLQNTDIEAVIVCTPPETHYDIGKQCLLHGKHILIEKPFTTSHAKANELVALAQQKGLKIMVDYTFLYTGAVQKIKELQDAYTLGKLLYVDSSRINLGLFQTDINVVWDLACHDLSIIKYVTGNSPLRVQANGASHFSTEFETIAYITLYYPDNVIVHVNCSWISPVKIRHMLIAGDKKAIVYNDIEPTDKVKVYDAAVGEKWSKENRDSTLIDYRHGDIYCPKLDNTEALKKVVEGFYGLIHHETSVPSDAVFALEILSILEGIQYSLQHGNCIVTL